MDYQDFVKRKQLLFRPSGFEPVDDLNPMLMHFQRDITQWALYKGRACLFEDCGLGKTLQQLEWSRQVALHEGGPVLIVAPLAVAQQTEEESKKFGIPVRVCTSQDEIDSFGINVTNYEKLHRFDGGTFVGVVLDESSILKNMAGKVRNQIIEMFRTVPYRLACTATPAPNDYMELGNHAEFLGVMTHLEMLSMFFVNDSGQTGQWRLKKHSSEREFWRWLCSWAVMLSRPSDLGYDEEGFDLPELKYIEHKLLSDGPAGGGLLAIEASTMSERRLVRKETVRTRCEKAAEIINATDDQWVVWCGLNEESELLSRLVEGSREITGTTEHSLRERLMSGFKTGEVHRLVTKPTIAGFGMNWQNCHHMAFVGLSDSWEQFYQAVRRIWRFGQEKSVEAHIIIEAREGAVLKNIKRKDLQAQYMIRNMVAYTSDIAKREIKGGSKENKDSEKKKMEVPEWMTC